LEKDSGVPAVILEGAVRGRRSARRGRAAPCGTRQSRIISFHSDHTLQATALVHEAYVKLLEQRSVDWKSRAHFFGIAAQMIIRILIDRARGHLRDKRGGGERPVPLDENFVFSPEQSEELIKLDQALEQLARLIRDRAKLWNCDSSGG
jgi:RNA polymerase sigma-70 factor, ECF subfamily